MEVDPPLLSLFSPGLQTLTLTLNGYFAAITLCIHSIYGATHSPLSRPRFLPFSVPLERDLWPHIVHDATFDAIEWSWSSLRSWLALPCVQAWSGRLTSCRALTEAGANSTLKKESPETERKAPFVGIMSFLPSIPIRRPGSDCVRGAFLPIGRPGEA